MLKVKPEQISALTMSVKKQQKQAIVDAFSPTRSISIAPFEDLQSQYEVSIATSAAR